jgi:hypothetical protein
MIFYSMGKSHGDIRDAGAADDPADSRDYFLTSIYSLLTSG